MFLPIIIYTLSIMSIEVLGFIAAFFTTSSFLPQVLKIIKTKDTSGISLLMYSFFSFGVFLWLVYGVIIDRPSIYICNIITLILALSVLILKIKN